VKLQISKIAFLIASSSIAQSLILPLKINWVDSKIDELIESYVWNDSLPYFKYEFIENVNVKKITIHKADTLNQIPSKIARHANFSEKLYYELFHFTENNVSKKGILIFPYLKIGEHELIKMNEIVLELEKSTEKANRSFLRAHQNIPENSIFKDGVWYRLATTQNGIHKIGYAQLQQMGIPIHAIDPRTIQIFGCTNGMLPQSNAEFRTWDPVENSIWIEGESDGKFDPQDYILFYSPGPHKWIVDSLVKKQSIETNLYSDTVYYYLTHSQKHGKRIHVDRTLPTSTAQNISHSFMLFYHEKDLVNIGKMGRKWYGEALEGQNRTFIVPTSDLIDNSLLSIETNVVSTSTQLSEFQILLNQNVIATRTIPGIGISSGYLDLVGMEVSHSVNVSVRSSNNISVTVQYNKRNNVNAQAYLDYVRIEYERLNNHFPQIGGVFYFNYQTASALENRFFINKLSPSTRVWDITTYYEPIQKTLIDGAFYSDNKLRRFIAFEPENTYNCIFLGKVKNQNLKGLEVPDLLIVTHPLFTNEANRLAEFRRKNDGLTVQVVETSCIFQEFSSGNKDITAIRDFARYLYLKDKTKLKYLLLFGDCSYDYKNRITPNTNFVPVYQARNSLSKTMGFSSDDYYGFFDENEGEWAESFANNDKMEIGIGRLPVRNQTEARLIVDKIIRYSTHPEQLGEWINEITFLTDDGDNNSHMIDVDKYIIKDIIYVKYPHLRVNKLYLNSYNQISTPVGQRSPALQSDLNRIINKGTLVLNYTGHGNENQLASEALITNQSLRNLTNNHKMFLLVTATCEFGKYDDPAITSGGEYALLNPNGAAIACLTTTRPVYQSSNRLINQALFRCLFEKIDNNFPRLGDIIKITKNNSITGVNNRNYALLGDPSLTLHYPKQKIIITKINNKDIPFESDTLKALKKIEIEGEILDSQNNLDIYYNGSILTKVYDKQKTKFTLAHLEGGLNNASISYTDMGNIINQVKTSIVNGKFNLQFIVPKDISYEYGNGELLLYSYNPTQKGIALGYTNSLIVGGASETFEYDDTPPQIELYMNDSTFKNEDVINKKSTLIAKLYDENGINLSLSGIGHEITAVLNEKTAQSLILNDYFTLETNTFKKGTIRYPFDSLPYGRNSLTLTVWDSYNNPNSKTIYFYVLSGNPLQINDFILDNLYESGYFNLTFGHNRAGEDLEVTLFIHDAQGTVLAEIKSEINEAPNRVSLFNLNFQKQDFSVLTKGLYIYRLIVKSKKDGSIDNEIKKIVVIK
jgi:hypothetical protein